MFIKDFRVVSLKHYMQENKQILFMLNQYWIIAPSHYLTIVNIDGITAP